VFELEADCTIPAEYVALLAFLDERHPAREAAIGRYLRARQGEHGGWPLVHGGPFNMSASVKAYYALRLIGDRADAPHMRRAREAILANGGAGTANVFTRILLALHGVLKWSAVPVIPVEIMLLPRWSPFHLARVSYWTRTVLVPLFVLAAKKPRARNTRGVRLDELFHGGRPRAARRGARVPPSRWRRRAACRARRRLRSRWGRCRASAAHACRFGGRSRHDVPSVRGACRRPFHSPPRPRVCASADSSVMTR
jgi:hypothetical protein